MNKSGKGLMEGELITCLRFETVTQTSKRLVGGEKPWGHPLVSHGVALSLCPWSHL